MTNDKTRELIRQAAAARLNSHSPYSGFRVGAALRTRGGRIFTGTNVENASFGLSNCAERTAIFTAVTAGERDFEAIAIVADGVQPTAPCGACRQVLVEFGLDMEVILAGEKGPDGPVRATTVGALVPDAFVDFRNPEGS
ncbi:cytidine deaminase [bacterium DOLJORAL78_65_58]|nr:MAG: cytidine deaminase [bacterium DOLZORAL124_64_63]PIE75626.1 MAG: cytidine deaminase [bacterium DOLJORAL78_65_58]